MDLERFAVKFKIKHFFNLKMLVKKLISQDAMLSYPDWTKLFVIHTDASDKQIGAVISQEGKPIAFFSRKFNTAQRNYTTTEKELLAIIEISDNRMP